MEESQRKSKATDISPNDDNLAWQAITAYFSAAIHQIGQITKVLYIAAQVK